MTHAITVRLNDDDHRVLQQRAEQLRLRPGTLARILVHAGLSSDTEGVGRATPRAALERLVSRSHGSPPADAVALVSEAREALETSR